MDVRLAFFQKNLRVLILIFVGQFTDGTEKSQFSNNIWAWCPDFSWKLIINVSVRTPEFSGKMPVSHYTSLENSELFSSISVNCPTSNISNRTDFSGKMSPSHLYINELFSSVSINYQTSNISIRIRTSHFLFILLGNLMKKMLTNYAQNCRILFLDRTIEEKCLEL